MKYFVCLLALVLSGCGIFQPLDKDGMIYEDRTLITLEQAKEKMAEDGAVIIDARTQEEYDEGHIPGAIAIPVGTIGTVRPEQLPDLDAVILIYCKEGRCASEAASRLIDLGYMHVYNFGGIEDWDGEIVK